MSIGQDYGEISIVEIPTVELPELLEALLPAMQNPADHAEVEYWQRQIAGRRDSDSIAARLAIDLCRAHLAQPDTIAAKVLHDRIAAGHTALKAAVTEQAAEQRDRQRRRRMTFMIMMALLPAWLMPSIIQLCKNEWHLTVSRTIVLMISLLYITIMAFLAWALMMRVHYLRMSGDLE